MLLLLKLLLVPALIALISLAARKWGPGVAGALAGFPVITGSILFILSLEQDAAFVREASLAAALGTSASCARWRGSGGSTVTSTYQAAAS